MVRIVAAATTGRCKHCVPKKNKKPKEGESENAKKLDIINYKNVRLLQRFSTPQGKLYGRKRSGLCAHCQRKLKRAVKRARFLALLPYAGQ